MRLLYDWISSDQAYQYHDDGDDEKDVDESAKRIWSYDAEKPEDDEYDCDCV